MKVGSKTKEDQ